MSAVWTSITYVPGAQDGAAFARLLARHSDLGFRPEKIRYSAAGRSRSTAFSDSALTRVSESQGVENVEVDGPDGSIGFGHVGSLQAHQVNGVTPGLPPSGLLEEAVAMPGFIAALVADDEDVFWQSADMPNTYDVHGMSHQDLPKYTDPTTGWEKIDLSGNPGRRTPVPGMWLLAASRMWFGPQAFSVLDRELLVSFADGSVTERPDGIVEVQLFDLTEPIDEVRAKQRRFREWMGYDDIERRAPELFRRVADPHVEIETGAFPHGGVRRIVEWLDVEGDRPVPRSRAAMKRVSELDQVGNVVWQEEVAA